jgi:hypothetical protein
MIPILVPGCSRFKSIFDGLRSAIAMVREARGSPNGGQDEGKLIDAAPDKASAATAIAEAEVAHALGYQLCKCEFPPTAMLTVGSTGRGDKSGAVYECPKCKFNTAMPFSFNRLPGR